MRELSVFNSVSLDGYFTGPGGDLSWAKGGQDDPEWTAFVSKNASGGGALLLGRVTYDMMVQFWPTEQAKQTMPEVAEGINKAPKLVFSRKLEKATWSNTKVLKGDPVAEVRRMKEESGPPMTILGSGSIVCPLAQAGLIDRYTFVVVPVALGKGRTMFDGLRQRVSIALTQTRAFANGNVVMSYVNGSHATGAKLIPEGE